MNTIVPTSINVNIDTPVEFKAKDANAMRLYLFSLTHKVVSVLDYVELQDGVIEYHNHHSHNNFPILEINGGLAYYDYGWKIFPQCVQERYADYIAEEAILGDK